MNSASGLDRETAAEFAAADQEALRGIARAEAGRIYWSGGSGTGRTVQWDIGLAREMRDAFAKTPSTRLYADALTAAIAEAEAYHMEPA